MLFRFSSHSRAAGLDFIICIEMFLFSVIHHFLFSYKDYTQQAQAAKMGLFRAFTHSLPGTDLFIDAWKGHKTLKARVVVVGVVRRLSTTVTRMAGGPGAPSAAAAAGPGAAAARARPAASAAGPRAGQTPASSSGKGQGLPQRRPLMFEPCVLRELHERQMPHLQRAAHDFVIRSRANDAAT